MVLQQLVVQQLVVQLRRRVLVVLQQLVVQLRRRVLVVLQQLVVQRRRRVLVVLQLEEVRQRRLAGPRQWASFQCGPRRMSEGHRTGPTLMQMATTPPGQGSRSRCWQSGG